MNLIEITGKQNQYMYTSSLTMNIELKVKTTAIIGNGVLYYFKELWNDELWNNNNKK